MAKKEKIVVNLSDDQKAKVVKDFCEEWSASAFRAESERTLQSESVKAISEDTGLDKKLLRRLAKVYHNQQFFTVKSDNEEFEDAYAKVFRTDQKI